MTNLPTPDGPNAADETPHPTFQPGRRYEGLRAEDVGRFVRDALFEAELRALSVHVALEADDFHITLTVLDAQPDTRPRAPYDD